MTAPESPATAGRDAEGIGAPGGVQGLGNDTADGVARRSALAAVSRSAQNRATALVDYRCEGRLLVIGPAPYAREQANGFGAELSCTVLAVDRAAEGGGEPLSKGFDGEGIQVIAAALVAIDGYLGHYTVTVNHAGREVDLGRALGLADGCFDLVLDLQRTPGLGTELPPPGYYAPGADPAALRRAVEELPGMVGEFQKPVYLAYDSAICAHARSGVSGCTRCLDSCPSGALRALGDGIAIDTHLCQGAGICAAACPSGAIDYVYPPSDTLLASLRDLLRHYREAGGSTPVILLHGAEAGAESLQRAAPRLPEYVLPWPLEEVGRVGVDLWLALSAYGAGAVWVLVDEGVTASVRTEIECQRGIAAAIMEGMGYPSEPLRLLDEVPEPGAAEGDARLPVIEAAGFAPPNEKRTVARLAVDHLRRSAPLIEDSVALPTGAPFGSIGINAETCTLCMSCVEVCPASALEAGGDSPRVLLVEQNCLQCEICERACPEDAISLVPRFLYDVAARRERRVLHEEPPFCCVICGKPFATRKLIARMHEKLAGHPMFQQPGALRRLEMCEDCRVKDMMRDGDGPAFNA